ncbi:Exodeoxyribonuclease III [Magnetococcus marinus MC-1]|uniref:Exodeoxyribonuclease III n=1 Tax=Magnetococcus marinus (strain ATCC BAA-1437 / JCM 17883 / MC-1) TaxID=156889 RepID=A0LAH4_MAGMM|nr:exodeoxyribonuclease III [Magnetococcus marinus]ABK44967.1 Exodeoxyribonuclease III [Magnetococcus marinus MC-1]
MRIATWNVNSMNVRQEHVAQWLAEDPCDLLCLQELKMVSEKFPAERFKSLGWHLLANGQKTYNGVAVLSRFPLEERDVVLDLPGVDPAQKRLMAVTVNGVRVVNCYVPNGSEVGSDKYHYKLDWLAKLQSFVQAQLASYPQLVVLGDYNIAPDDRDVHDVSFWAGKILVSPPERSAYQALCGLGLTDAFRHLQPEGGYFSWWDYRLGSFQRNMGVRIDHLLSSPALTAKLTHCHIDREPRGWERPSDHAPVIATYLL